MVPLDGRGELLAVSADLISPDYRETRSIYETRDIPLVTNLVCERGRPG